LVPPLFVAIYVTLIGAIIGSFLNVVIHRYPRGESVVFPPSRCPYCRERIKWYDNVPVISYLLLLGKCRNCRAPISFRYPLVEAANALFYLAIYLRTGVTMTGALVAVIVSMTIALIYIDADIQILPDVIDLPGIAVGITIGALPREEWVNLTLPASILDSILGAIIGGGILWAVAISYQLIRKVEGMGLGDVKMLAMIGASLGAAALFPVVMIASISGAITGGIIALVTRRRDLQFPLPFGIFLGFGTLIVLFFGYELRTWVPFFGLPL
jgi:leader peptidase (prepilin peptidase)/N-methyltransferase